MFKNLQEDIQQIRKSDPSARSTLEILLCYPGLHALVLHRFSHRLWNSNHCLLARIVSHLSRGLTGIDIHPGATIGQRCVIDHGAGVVIGETAQIGNDVVIYHGVTLGAARLSHGKRHPTIDDGVMLGAGAKILGPITVHRGAKVGANAVVLQDVPAFATAVGVPARIIIRRNPDALAVQNSSKRSANSNQR